MELSDSDVMCAVCTEPLGGVKNLQVTDPTTNSLRVRWEPAEGDVRQYNIIYVPAAGGTESMVRFLCRCSAIKIPPSSAGGL